MKRLLSIRVIFQSITAVMAVTLVSVCGLAAEHALQRRVTDQRLLRTVAVSRDLFGAMQEIRLERGGLAGRLAAPEAFSPADVDAVLASRDQSNRSLDQALTALAGDPSAENRATLARIKDRRSDYDATQAQVLAALRLPLGQRPMGLAARWIAVDNAFVGETANLAHRLAAEDSVNDPVVSEMMKLKQMVWWTRDATGANDGLLSRALSVGKLTPQDEAQLAAQSGRASQAWNMVIDEATMPTVPAVLKAAVKRADKVYFTDFEATRQTALAELAAGRPLTIPHAAISTQEHAGLAAMMAVAGVAFDISQARAEDALADADRDVAVSAALMILAVIMGVGSMLYINVRVVSPIGRVTAAMAGVAGGDLSRDIPYQRRSDEIGALARALGVFRRNALEKRRMEDELVRSRVAVEAAEAASRLKSQFLANMSHEIRTPLNGVLGMVQVMELEPLDPVQAERLGIIRDSGRVLLQILNDVLDLSKIEAGELELTPTNFDMAQLVERTCAAFSGAAGAKGLLLNAQIADGARGIWSGDDVRLRQILSNLISNAIKFTDRGAVSVSLERRRSGLSLAVRDSGIGISEEALPKLFGKFSQVDDFNTRRFGGTGLGLAISRELAQRMGGDIEVQSTPGVGSTFRVSLPLRRIGELPEAAAAQPANAPPTSGGQDRPIRILAAEDNLTNQKVLAALLSPLGLDLTIVGDGQEAIDHWRAAGCDLILMDIQMPGVSGVAAAQAIRAEEARRSLPPTPIIALSANAMSHQVGAYLAAGMNAHVAKPIDASQLYQAIEEALAEDQGPANRAAVAS